MANHIITKVKLHLVLHLIGMTKFNTTTAQICFGCQCLSHAHYQPYSRHLTNNITKLHNMHSITNSDTKLKNQPIQNIYCTINNQQS